MRFLVAAALLASAVSAATVLQGREQLVKAFGTKNIKFDPKTKTNFCNQCHEITVSSTGGTLEHQPQRLGKYAAQNRKRNNYQKYLLHVKNILCLCRYVVDGSIWEDMIPFWKSANNQYITPDPNSNPIMYYIKWVVSEMVGGFNAGVMNEAYTDGYNCPYEIPDQWQYEYNRQW